MRRRQDRGGLQERRGAPPAGGVLGDLVIFPIFPGRFLLCILRLPIFYGKVSLYGDQCGNYLLSSQSCVVFRDCPFSIVVCLLMLF